MHLPLICLLEVFVEYLSVSPCRHSSSHIVSTAPRIREAAGVSSTCPYSCPKYFAAELFGYIQFSTLDS